MQWVEIIFLIHSLPVYYACESKRPKVKTQALYSSESCENSQMHICIEMRMYVPSDSNSTNCTLYSGALPRKQCFEYKLVNIRENKGEWFGMMYLLGAIRRL
jgi:hypothetical protein